MTIQTFSPVWHDLIRRFSLMKLTICIFSVLVKATPRPLFFHDVVVVFPQFQSPSSQLSHFLLWPFSGLARYFRYFRQNRRPNSNSRSANHSTPRRWWRNRPRLVLSIFFDNRTNRLRNAVLRSCHRAPAFRFCRIADVVLHPHRCSREWIEHRKTSFPELIPSNSRNFQWTVCGTSVYRSGAQLCRHNTQPLSLASSFISRRARRCRKSSAFRLLDERDEETCLRFSSTFNEDLSMRDKCSEHWIDNSDKE